MDKVWYYMKRDKSKYGPYSEMELVNMIQQGVIQGNEYIWMADLAGWLKVENSIYAFYLPQEINPDIFPDTTNLDI